MLPSIHTPLPVIVSLCTRPQSITVGVAPCSRMVGGAQSIINRRSSATTVQGESVESATKTTQV